MKKLKNILNFQHKINVCLHLICLLYTSVFTPITKSELEYAIQTLKDKKATGLDEIPFEI